MEVVHIIAFNGALLAAIASPGPSLMFLIKSTLAGGRRIGVLTAAGLATMAALWTLMALLGLDGLFHLFPWAYVALKTLGALYLIYVAWMTWQNAKHPIAVTSPPTGQRAFLSGILVNLANPKSVIFAAAVLVVIFPPALTTGQKAMIFANHLGVELCVQSTLAILFSTAALRRRYLAAKTGLDRFSALVLGALGLRLLFDR